MTVIIRFGPNLTAGGWKVTTILFNMLVNGIPTQYETTLNRKIYEHAHSYNVSVEVSQKNGIIVFNWQNQSWVEDLELN